MNPNPQVSIITPCFNSENYIQRYIDSILAQNYDNIQLIFVLDGSLDSTDCLLFKNTAKITERGYEFTYIFRQNKGLGGAINTGLKAVTGDYFTWCDSDNFYTEDYVSSKVRYFCDNPEYAVVRCNGYVVDESDIGKPLRLMADGNRDLYNEHLFENCLLVRNFHFGCAMVRTKDFDRVNPHREIYPSRAGQNWQLLLPMFYHYKSGYIDKPMFYFVIRQDSISNITQYQGIEKQIDKLDEYERIITNTLNSMEFEDRDSYLKKVKLKYSRQKFYIYAYAHHNDEALQEYRYLKANGATSLRLWLVLMRCRSITFDKLVRILR